MPGSTITGTLTTGLTLNDPATQLPLTVTASGRVTKSQGNAITGVAGTAWTVSNAGTINGAYYGVYLASGGLVTNTTSTAVIGNAGVHIVGAAGTIVNSGTLGAGYNRGAVLEAGGTVVNNAGGTSGGVFVRGGAGSVGNAGTMSYANLYLGGSVTNTGTIPNFVKIAGAAGTVVNSGSINHVSSQPTESAVGLAQGGSVSNAGEGRITSGADGVTIGGGLGVVVNAGTVAVTQSNAHYGFHVYQHARAIILTAGGSVSNTGSVSATGTFSNTYSNLYASLAVGIRINGAAGTVTNSGSINARGTFVGFGTAIVGVGIELGVGGQVTNQAGGTITARSAVESYGDATVVNAGQLTGSDYGVTLRGTGRVTNQAGGTISGFFDGIRAVNAAATVGNGGSIDGPQNYAIRLGANGLILNAAGGRLTGGNDGVLFDGVNASLNNAGYIHGFGTYKTTLGSGAYLSNGGTITNSGTISGRLFGVSLNRPGFVGNTGTISGATGIGVGGTAGTGGTVVNSGTISGTGGTAVKFAAGDDRLVLGQGAAFSGTVDGGAGTNTLEFASGTGTLAGLGISVINFSPIVFDAGAQWTVAGNAAGLGGVITGFAAGDALDLTGLNETGKSYANGTLTLTGDATVNLQLPGTFTTASFILAPDGSGGTTVTVACFAEGTRLATARGPVAVEDLRADDQVVTHGDAIHEGGLAPIVWIGHRRVDCLRHPRPEEVRPVRVRAGAFGAGLPARDLRLSPDHALFVDDALIPVRHLVDGVAVVRETVAAVRYFHVELPAHDIVLAEGLPCESYLDTDDRASFANGGDVVRLHPGFAPWRREAMLRAPLVVSGPVLEAVRRRLARGALRRSAWTGTA